MNCIKFKTLNAVLHLNLCFNIYFFLPLTLPYFIFMYDINGNLTVTYIHEPYIICTNNEDFFFIIIFLFLWFMAVWNMMQYTVHWY